MTKGAKFKFISRSFFIPVPSCRSCRVKLISSIAGELYAPLYSIYMRIYNK